MQRVLDPQYCEGQTSGIIKSPGTHEALTESKALLLHQQAELLSLHFPSCLQSVKYVQAYTT